MSSPVSGEQHERAVEAIDPRGAKFGLSPLALGQITNAYLASLREQGDPFVRLSEVAELLRSDDTVRRIGRASSECVALLVERRFGGNERSE